MKRRIISIAGTVVLGMVMALTAQALDTRLIGMNNPTLSQSQGAEDSGLANVVFPTDEFGLGLSAVVDENDIWKLPARLADARLFSTSTCILDYSAVNRGSLGIVIASDGLPVTLGFFAGRPTQNDWVLGRVRQVFLGQDFFTSALAGVTAPLVEPLAPGNLIDALIAMRLGLLSVGAGLGWSYHSAVDSTSNIVGTADSAITSQASSSVLTIRAGAGLDLAPAPLRLDFGATVPIGGYTTKFVSGANAFPPAENDSIDAGNTVINLSGRLFVDLTRDLEGVFLADYAVMTQNYSAKNNGADLPGTVILKDYMAAGSFGVGAGVNWRSGSSLMNALLSGVFGGTSYIQEAPAAANRPPDSTGWNALRMVLDGEFPLSQIFVLRGGLGSSLAWKTVTVKQDTGGVDSKITNYYFTPSAAAGLGVKLTDFIDVDFVANLTNFTSATFLQTPFWRTSLQIELKGLAGLASSSAPAPALHKKN